MKKSKFFLSALTLLSLASCGTSASSSALSSTSGESSPLSSDSSSAESSSSSRSSSASSIPDSPLTLFDANSIFVGTSYGSEDCFPLATYRHKDFGDVPFVELGQFIAFFKSTSVPAPKIVKRADHLYSVESDGVIGALLNTETETLSVLRFDYLIRAFTSYNNGVPFDSCNANIADESSVHGSEYTRTYGDNVEEVYDLREYHMDLVEADGKVYVPFQLFSNLLLRTLGADTIYNGHDYFLSSLSGVNQASCYTSNDTFRYDKILHSPAETLPEGELHRYVGEYPSPKDESKRFGIFALTANGEGAYFHAATADAEIPEKPEAKLIWEIKEGDVFVGYKMWNPAVSEYSTVADTFRIRHGAMPFNSKTRSQALADFNYNLLRFQFDELYGLRPELKQKQGYVDFDSFVTAKGLKAGLMSLDTRVYDEALADFTMRYVDDGHTKYTDRSLYSGMEEKDGAAIANEHMGPRRSGLFVKLTQYQALRKEALGETDPIGVFMEGETAVIRFDSFVHIGAVIPELPASAKGHPISEVMALSTPWGFDMCFEEIKKNDNIKNVVLDLTCNGGGLVLTLPYLAACFTKDPIFLSYDASMDVEREFHYRVDLNHNGVFGDEGDTYEGKYNFFLLTSDFSFSCASALPSIAHIAGVKMIGKQSGGGACSVGGYADAMGSIYTSSSPLQIGYRDEQGKFVNDDAGVPVDYPLAEDSWYDLVKLNTFVKGLVNPA